MTKQEEAPLAQGLDEVQDHIQGLVPWTGHPEVTEVATYLSSGGIDRIPLLSFLVEQTAAQAAGTPESRDMLQGSGVTIVKPKTEHELNIADILANNVRVSPAFARVLRVYVPHPTPDDDVSAFERHNTVFVPSKW